jgi:AhpD family alkylhydroperoxidase
MSSTTTPHLNLIQLAPEQFQAQRALARSVTLDRRLRELVNMRVSQLNGCAFCLDMHAEAARAAGETQQRLDVVAGWREAPFFDARERAALALAEALTTIERGHVPEAVLEQASAHFDDEELAQLLFVIAVINSWNRLMLASRTPPPAR